MADHMRNLAMLATLTLAGCGAMPNIGQPTIKERNDFKGQPLGAVTARLGYPMEQDTLNGQKVYYWRLGTALQECRIKSSWLARSSIPTTRMAIPRSAGPTRPASDNDRPIEAHG